MRAALVAVLCVGCAALPTPRPRQQDTPAPRGDEFSSIALVASIAAADFSFDQDWDEPPAPMLDWGEGVALALDAGPHDHHQDGGLVALGVEYARSEHDELRTGTRTELHLAAAHVGYRPWRIGGATSWFGPRLVVGAGYLYLDHGAGGPHDADSPVAVAGLELELGLLDALVLRAGGRYLFAGYPSETVGTGGLMYLGGGIRF